MDHPHNMQFIRKEWRNFLNVRRFVALESATKSHYKILQNIWSNRNTLTFPIVVMEDDVFRRNNFTKYWNELKNIPDSDYVAFDAFFLKFRPKPKKESKNFVSLLEHRANGFTVYFKQFFDRFKTLDAMSNVGGRGPIDMHLTHNPLFVNLTPKEQIVRQIVTKMSTTQHRKTGGYLHYYVVAEKALREHERGTSSGTSSGTSGGTSDQTTDWKPYRLADIIKNAGYEGVSYQALLTTYTQKFPNSIATEYLTKNKKKDFNEKLFFEMIENRLKIGYGNVNYFIPVAVVHLRLGDVINNASKQWHGYSKYHYNGPNNGYTQYVYPYQYYNSIVLPVIPKNVKTIHLVGSTVHSYNDKHISESKKYVSLVTQYFISKGYKVTSRIDSGATPDEDFLYMASSTFFVQSGGGYSKFIAKIVKLRGGQAMFQCLCPPLCKCW